jgi:hypothetical protein
MYPYLVDTPILNNNHTKNCQKTHKNPKEKIHTPLYNDIYFYWLIGLILL